jgi:hypothetical protein
MTAGAFVLMLAVAGCDDLTGGDGIRGSGSIITESRDVSGFDAVEILGSGDVVIDVTGNESLTVATDDNLMELLTTDVVGGTLRLSVEPNTSISPSRDIVYRISAAELARVSVLGSAAITVTGMDASSFELEIAGSGDVQLSGKAESFEVVITGSGDVDGAALVAKVSSVRIAGSGDVVVNVTDELAASISGSGDVSYIGNPVVTQSVSGSGNIGPR